MFAAQENFEDGGDINKAGGNITKHHKISVG